ncbi:unnamed protein product [Closterium sp. Yama58-4]|nr:unnamed protein product [Closterium sp. Yama58-4]
MCDADCKKRCEAFWEFVRQMRVLNNYLLNLIVNADQTPLFLEMPVERTIEMKGARTVHVRTARYEKQRVTVMLAVTAGGLKLPPYVVFQRKTMPKFPIPREELVKKTFITCGISTTVNGSEDHLILAHLRDKAEVEVLEDVCEEELEELVPNPFYPDPAASASKDSDAELVAEAGEEEEDSVEDGKDSEEEEEEEEEYEEHDEEEGEEDDEEDEEEEGEEDGSVVAEKVGAGGGWEDDGEEWWAEGRYDGEEVETWVAGQDDD